MKQKIIIYWSRRDFRLRDNPALFNAVHTSAQEKIPLAPIFFIEPYMTAGNPRHQFGYPSRIFLAQALSLWKNVMTGLLIFQEKPTLFFRELQKTHDFEIFVNEDIHPDFYAQIKKIKALNIPVKIFRDQLTISKETITKTGGYYSVFTPFKKAVWNDFINEPETPLVSLEHTTWCNGNNFPGEIIDVSHPKNREALFSKDESISINGEIINIGIMDLPKRSLEYWYYSEDQALNHFHDFVKHKLLHYADQRDSLDSEGTSQMSLALTWGLVSARTLVKIIQDHYRHTFKNLFSEAASDKGPIHFISELIWREFYKYIYFHNPKLFAQPFQEKYASIQWVPRSIAFQRFNLWIQGKTGYPIVDAAMMQLATTGWMHNRARMIVASVLTKHLGVDWRWGQEYFRAMLIDLDEASNNGGWQWGASVGADPKPIRIFNPYLQAKNYDSERIYQTMWLSETYRKNPPVVVIEHHQARDEALVRYGLGKHAPARDY